MAIQSIIGQSYQNLELIIVDDGSQDDTWAKITAMRPDCKARFKRTFMARQDNCGTCTTLNKLLDLAQGEYVFLMASDDVVHPECIAREAAFLQSHSEYALVVGNNEFIDHKGQRCYWDQQKQNVYDRTAAVDYSFADHLQRSRHIDFSTETFGSYQSLYLGNYVPNGYLIRKSIFQQIGRFTPQAPLEDWWLMLQIAKYAKMKYINEIVYSYRWHQQNSIKQRSHMLRLAKQTMDFEHKLLTELKPEQITPEIEAVQQRGCLYKTFGIPRIFQILSYKRHPYKIKVVKLLGLTIGKLSKAIRYD